MFDFAKCRAVVWIAAIGFAGSAGLAQAVFFETPIQFVDIDGAVTADWSGGVLRTSPTFGISAPGNLPAGVLFTQSTKPGSGWAYGASTNSGPRHVRLGFNRAIPVGTVLALGDSVLSVLAPGVAYPGNLTNEQNWIPAQRLTATGLSTNFPAVTELSTWLLPPGTTTRALRFSHVSNPSDSSYQGTLSGVYVLAERFANIAPQAVAIAVSNDVDAPLLNNSLVNALWDSGGQTSSPVVSNDAPQDILLVWPTNVVLNGLCALHAGFSEAEVDRYDGPADRHPREASESDWIRIGSYTNIQYQVPRRLTPNWLAFGNVISTRSIRLRITKSSDPIKDTYYNSFGGKRVCLGELFALTPLNNLDLMSAVITPPPEAHPPIPVPFVLDAPGIVTLVIEDAAGKRVRNLISETPFAAGTNVAWWDGLDESGRVNTMEHGIYEVQGNLVPPGSYHSRGLVRDPLDLRYEFTVGTEGNPPWRVAWTTYGGWLADHRPPSDVIFMPGTNAQMLIGSEVAEAGDGLVWADLQGHKLKGRTALAPGGFYSASHLAFDSGGTPVTGVSAYAGFVNSQGMFFYGISAAGDAVPLPSFAITNQPLAGLTGMAVRNGLLFASVGPLNQVRVIDARKQIFLATNTVPDPRGLAFDANGQLLVLSQAKLLRCSVNTNSGALGEPATTIAGGLDDPRGLALDGTGNIYISQWGNRHQVAVFSPQGAALRTIGTPGAPVAGPYNPNHMNHPNGLAIAGDGRLWVSEYDPAPKRISIWSTNGVLDKALYGPPKYGGGGRLDPLDKTRFYYGDCDDNDVVPYFIGLEYKLDWTTGSNHLANVYYRTGTNGFHLPYSGPETALYVNGRHYMVNTHNSTPVCGSDVAGIWQMRNSIAVPVAAIGRSSSWSWLARSEFAVRLPAGSSLSNTIFAWSDLNDDGIAQAEEVTFKQALSASIYVGEGLSIMNGRALALAPRGFTAQGAPIYDLADATVMIPGVVPLGSSGGGELFATTDGSYVQTGGPMVGYRNGQIEWSYPSQWPSLHASHSAPLPSSPGELIGTTRLLGGPFTPGSGEAGEIWAVNGNLGNCYLLTVDGLFIATLFKDIRTAPGWSMPAATRGMLLNEVSLFDECFWPSISKTADGEVYLCAGKTHSSIVRLDGLDSIRRLPVSTFSVTTQQLATASTWLLQREAEHLTTVGRETLQVGNFQKPPVMDGVLNVWTNNWITVDDRVRASLAIGQGNLYVAFQTGDNALLLNSGESSELLFKTGGALDLMIGTTNPNADSQRVVPVAGDLRLLVSRVNGMTRAVLYRPVVPGTANPVPFSSPLRTVYCDRVDDVSAQVVLQSGTNGDYELAVPLATLGLNPLSGQTILGDVGVLRGNAGKTIQRDYWQNKATALVSDIPSEAELTPQLWGRWHFAGTNGTASLFHFDRIGDRCRFSLQTDLGSFVVIESSTNLMDWTFATNFTSSSSISTVDLQLDPGEPWRFFRSVQVP